MLTASMIQINGAGRVVNSSTQPTGGGNGYTPIVAASALCLSNAAPSVYSNGLPYTSPNWLVAASESPPVSFSGGYGFDAAGKLACDSVGAVASYTAGLPRTAAGALAIVTAIGP